MAKAMGGRKTLDGFAEINHDAAGIDVGNAQHWVAVPSERNVESVKMFGCFTADLHALANWLEQCGIKTVAMESTGVYWIALYEVLESRGFQVCVVNARQAKNLPGRKTDVKDCQWLQQLHTYGLLTASFRPQGGDHRSAPISPASRDAGAGSSDLHSTNSEGAHRNESAAGQCDQRYQRYNWVKNPACDRRRRTRPTSPGCDARLAHQGYAR